MKKTLIALMALAGVACGAETALTCTDINTSIVNQLTEYGYTEGDSFSITLSGITTLGSTDVDWLLNTGTDIRLRNQSNYFVSVNYGNNTSNQWLDSSKYTVDTETKTATLTLALADLSGKAYWYAGRFATSEGATVFYANGNVTPSAITSLSVEYDADTTTSTFTVVRGDASTHILEITGLELNAKDISFAHEGTKGTSVSVSVASIPEPATATLGLLALAGLCARRRRG